MNARKGEKKLEQSRRSSLNVCLIQLHVVELLWLPFYFLTLSVNFFPFFLCYLMTKKYQMCILAFIFENLVFCFLFLFPLVSPHKHFILHYKTYYYRNVTKHRYFSADSSRLTENKQHSMNTCERTHVSSVRFGLQ